MTTDEKACPNCGGKNTERHEVDIGVGVQFGPWYCMDCGWQEPEIDYGITENTEGMP